MIPQEPTGPILEGLRELPVELSLDQVEQLVAAFPLAATPTAWYHHFTLNNILMTTAASLLIGGAIHLFTHSAPTTEPHVVQAARPSAEQPQHQAPPTVTDPQQPPAPAAIGPTAPAPAVLPIDPPAPLPPPSPMAPSSAIPEPPAALDPIEPLPAVAQVAAIEEPEAAPCCTKTRKLDLRGFSGIRLHGSLDITLEQGDFEVVISGQEEQVDRVRAEVGNNTLVVSQPDSKGWNTSDDVMVSVRMPDLSELEVFGSGTMHGRSFRTAGKVRLRIQGSGDLKMEALTGISDLEVEVIGSGDAVCDNAQVSGSTRLQVTGSGDIKVAGRTERLEVMVTGSGDVQANDLRATRSKVTIQGSGDCYVNSDAATEQVINGTGKVHPSGSGGER
jgi:hypothetical protein